ncbi:spermatogenesis-associated C-terminus [Mactra antiquata]
MADLHVYVVPPDIWREKYHNALNQNINDTISLGFIRVHPETKIYALREEIEQQLGSDLVPREYVFVKSVGRSLTRLKARQEASLKVKNFLPPQAYAPELYLLEATPEVRQQIAASSEGSTRPQTRTSYDYDYTRQNPSQHHPAITSRQHQQSGNQEDYLPPLSATPPHTDSEKHGHRNRHGNHGNSGSQHKHDEDSGIAGFTPETYRENDQLDRRKGNNDQNDRLKPPSPTGSGPLNQSHDDNDMSDWDKRRQEDQDRSRHDDDDDRQRGDDDDGDGKRDEREEIAEQAEMMKTNSDEDMKRYPSPPPLRLASPERDSESARARRQKQKEELLKELEKAKEARKASERMREELVKHAKQMQTKTQNKRNHARDLWKKRYFEEKKKTGPLEEQCNRLRHELDIIHKKLLTTLEGPKEKATKLNELKPANKVGSPGRPLNNFKIQATRLQHEIEDIRRRVDHAKMKLTSEMKLRNQAETELRALRAELTQKKINLTLSRNSHLTTYAPPAADVNLISARAGITPRS